MKPPFIKNATTTSNSRIKVLLSQLPKLAVNNLSPLQTFTNLNALPLEIRNRIWAIAASEPRVVALYTPQEDDEDFPYFIQSPIPHTQHNIPPILHTTFESRKEGLRYYKYCLEGNYMSEEKLLQASALLPSDSSLKKIYINFAVDRFTPIEYTCSCGFENPIQVFSANVLSQIRYLDLKMDVSGDNPSCTTQCFWSWMNLFPNLTELELV